MDNGDEQRGTDYSTCYDLDYRRRCESLAEKIYSDILGDEMLAEMDAESESE